MAHKPIPPTPVIRAAFAVGADICEALGGYHFHVLMKNGQRYDGLPEIYADDGVLMLDAIGGQDTPILDINEIAAITVVEV
ncbi:MULTISPECIES: hypothetical protein [unclassified Mesorhizobium]|uniref:hypothetical protein n=1 Tax=unclassified Mesorhizobium TaxID=325217 RepID=UPI001129135E|nr:MULTISPECIES: hypothetical protein [unclassified Mesorhizobium]TPL42574.1 hypothetical protein FJ961_07745 [Mesorhizobium sp. B2-4-5]TPL66574.1 hypothetical protein FJ949_09405 [Mesorhizobium sp. B2-4-1]